MNDITYFVKQTLEVTGGTWSLRDLLQSLRCLGKKKAYRQQVTLGYQWLVETQHQKSMYLEAYQEEQQLVLVSQLRDFEAGHWWPWK